MSRIIADLTNDELMIKKVRAKQSDKDTQIINLVDIPYGKLCKSKVKISNVEQRNQIILLNIIPNELFIDVKKRKAMNAGQNESDIAIIQEKYEEDVTNDTLNRSAVVVFINKGNIWYCYGKLKDIYKKLIKFKYKVVCMKLNKKRGLSFYIFSYFLNKYNLPIEDTYFKLNDLIVTPVKIKVSENKISKYKLLFCGNTIKVNINDIKKSEIPINNNFKMAINIGDEEVLYSFGKKSKKIKNKKYYYCPIKKMVLEDFAYHIRRSRDGNYVLVKRTKEEIEDNIKFRFLESNFVSFILYKCGRIYRRTIRKITRKKINLFYEKFASKSEEGVLELCEKCSKNKKSKNFFIIDSNSKDYERVKKRKNIVKKYSLKYYNLIYKCDSLISSEAPLHLNILRSNNKYLRKALYQKKFIFLQHGVTYMKAHENNSPFLKGKESTPTYMIVGSEKEKDIVSDMLGLREEKLINAGLPIFDTIKYKHITNDSDDIVTIMLTWKPYEEYLYDFTESTYYKNLVEIYGILQKYIDKEKIVIIPHPKVFDLLANTDMIDNVWQGTISEVLAKTKLLITDYSSVCYNVFYQGAGVIFYQPDLDFYEKSNGKLIPDDDEYIGHRAFNIDELEKIILKSIVNEKIDLNDLRTETFENNYITINEFHDGKNIDRIYDKLLELKLI